MPLQRVRRPGPTTPDPDQLPLFPDLAPATLPADAVERAVGAAPPPGALLTPKQAAARLAVGERTLERWRRVGGGPRYVKLSIKTIRYTAESLDAFVAAGLRNNTAQ